MIVKVCGMRDAGNIRAVEAVGADMIGLVFYKKSPRCVGMINSRSGLIPDFLTGKWRLCPTPAKPEQNINRLLECLSMTWHRT